MALKRIELSFQTRYAAHSFFGRPRQEVNLDSTLKSLEIYEQFGLESVSSWIEENGASGTVDMKDVREAKVEPIVCRVDETYLRWLRDKLEAHDWSVAVTSSGSTVHVPVAMGVQICVGKLGKALNAALAGPDTQEAK